MKERQLCFEKIPGLREFAGSLLIRVRRKVTLP
jgi:hypothetical protein